MIGNNNSDNSNCCIAADNQSNQFNIDQPIVNTNSNNNNSSKSTKQHSLFHRIISFGNNQNNSQQQHLNKNVLKEFHVGSKSDNCDIVSKKSSANCRDELKSVQSLKNFWISAFGTGHHSKSVSINNLEHCHCKCPNVIIPDRSKCMSLDRNTVNSLNVTNNGSISSSSATASFRKSSIDNFYKYKTADLVKNNRTSNNIHTHNCSASSTMKNCTKMLNSFSDDHQQQDKIINRMPIRQSNVCESKAMTAICCAVRDDIVLNFDKRNSKLIKEPDNTLITNNNDSDNRINFSSETQIETMEYADKKSSHNNNTVETTNNNDSVVNVDVTETNNKTSDNMTIIVNEDNNFCNDSKIKCNSSTSSMLATESPSRKSRKCTTYRTNSFHHHHHKKMASSSIGGSGSSSVGGSKVAALTLRFNQIIQQDTDMQAKVKRNKEIILHRVGNHVFKVKEDIDCCSSSSGSVKKRNSSKKNDLGDTVSTTNSSTQKVLKKKPSLKRKSSINKTGHKLGSVKAKIQVFEPHHVTEDGSVKMINNDESQKPPKPKVPDKSIEVLQRTKEIARKRQTAVSATNIITKSDTKTHTIPMKVEIALQISRERCATLEKIKEVDEKKEEIEIDIPKVKTENIISETLPTTNNKEEEEVEDKSSSKKSKYIRLYEKLRFKPLFSSSSSKKYSQAKTASTANISKSDAICEVPPPSSLLTSDITLVEHKIFDAISTDNEQRIEHLSKSENCLRSSFENDDDPHYQKVTENMKPNISFLYRSKSAIDNKLIFGSQQQLDTTIETPVEAINQFLINKTRSMDEIHFSSHEKCKNSPSPLKPILLEEDNFGIICQQSDDFFYKNNQDNKAAVQKIPDNNYEIVNKLDGSDIYQSISDARVNTKKSFVDRSDIYQSICDARSGIDTPRKELKDCDSLNSYESLENYDVVDELHTNNARHINNTNTNDNENGYEICNPPEPPPPRKPSIPSSPDPLLPAPKRIFNSNPPPLPDITSLSLLRTNKSQNTCAKPPSQNDDAYRDYECENIYDTIKTVDSALSIMGNGNGGGGGDYESISSVASFLRSKNMLRHADSTSTLSSDNKTNSLYGTASAVGINDYNRGVTPSSEREISDNNSDDDWIDIPSNGETDDVKHKFVV